MIGGCLRFDTTRCLSFRLRIHKRDTIFDAVGAAVVWRNTDGWPFLDDPDTRIVEAFLWNSDGAIYGGTGGVKNAKELAVFHDGHGGEDPNRLWSSGDLLEIEARSFGTRLNLELRRIRDDGVGSDSLAFKATGIEIPSFLPTPEWGQLYIAPIVRFHQSSTATLESWDKD